MHVTLFRIRRCLVSLAFRALPLLIASLCVVPAAVGQQGSDDPDDLDALFEQAFGTPAEPQSIRVRLHVDRSLVGEVPALVTPGGRLTAFSAQPLLSSLGDLLTDGSLSVLSALVDDENTISAQALSDEGVAVDYDRNSMRAEVTPPGEMRRTVRLSVRPQRSATVEEGVSRRQPAAFGAGTRLELGLARSDTFPDTGDSFGESEASFGIEPFFTAFDWTLETGATLRIRSGGGDPQFTARDTRLLRYWSDIESLLTIGDLTPEASLFGSRRTIQGVSLSRSAAPGSSSGDPLAEFSVDRFGPVDVVVNDQRIVTRELGPGSYELVDVPLALGFNEVELRFPDDPERTPITLMTPHDSSLLASGEHSFFHAFGVPPFLFSPHSEPEVEGLRGSFRHRYGFSDTLTAGAGAQLSTRASQVAVGLDSATALGNLGLESALSYSELVEFGFAGRLSYGLFFPANRFRPSFRFSAGWFGPGLSTPDTPEGNRGLPLRLTAAYGQRFGAGFSGTLRGALASDPVSGRSDYSAHAGVSAPRREGAQLSVGLELRGSSEITRPTRFGGHVAVRMRPSNSVNVSYRQDLASPEATLSGSGSRTVEDVGRFSGGLRTRHTFGDNTIVDDVSARTSLSGRRGAVSVNSDASFGQGDLSRTSVSGSAETGLYFADGLFAVAAPPTPSGSFVIVAIGTGSEIDELEVDSPSGPARVRPGFFGAAVIPTGQAYESVSVGFSTPSLPLGYELRDRRVAAETALRSVTVLAPELSGVTFVRGTITGSETGPVGLETGRLDRIEADAPNETVEPLIFTNAEGRFEARGLRSGEYMIEMSSGHMVRFSVPDETVGFLDLGILSIDEEDE